MRRNPKYQPGTRKKPDVLKKIIQIYPPYKDFMGLTCRLFLVSSPEKKKQLSELLQMPGTVGLDVISSPSKIRNAVVPDLFFFFSLILLLCPNMFFPLLDPGDLGGKH